MVERTVKSQHYLQTPRQFVDNGHQIIDMLFIREEQEDGTHKEHFAWIKDIDKLSCTITKSHKKKVLCQNCMNYQTEKAHTRHVEICLQYKVQKVRYPNKGKVKQFENYGNQLKAPSAIYVDFESILKVIEKVVEEKKKAKTVKLNEHIPYSFCIYLVTDNKKKHKPVLCWVNSNDPKLDTAEKLMDEFFRHWGKESWLDHEVCETNGYNTRAASQVRESTAARWHLSYLQG